MSDPLVLLATAPISVDLRRFPDRHRFVAAAVFGVTSVASRALHGRGHWRVALICFLVGFGGTPAFGQGGGVANSIGISIENSANSAAAQSQSAAMGDSASSGAVTPGGSSAGVPSSSGMMTPGMSTPGAAGDIELGGGAEYDEYGGGDSSGGMMPGPGYGRPQQQPAAAGVEGAILGAMGSYTNPIAEFFNRPLGPEAMRFRPTLLERAAFAAAQGDQRQAMAYFYAHMIAEPETAAAAIEAVRYSPLMRRPAWVQRVGVSVEARIADEFSDDPQPIREGMEPPETAGPRRGRGLARGRGGAQYGAGGGAMEAGGAMESGSAGFEEMESGMLAAGGGAAEMSEEMMMMSADGAMGMPGGRRAAAEEPVRELVDTKVMADEILDRHLGLLAEMLKAELSRRVSAGQFGTVLTDLESRGTAIAEKMLASDTSAGESIEEPYMWIPGVDFVGIGSLKEILEECRNNEIAVLFHFDVIVKETRTEDSQYDARLRVINCVTEKAVGVSKSISKRDVLLAGQRRDLTSVLNELIQPAFAALDEQAALRPMPPLSPRHAASRIDALLASSRPDRIDYLAEIAMFRAKGLITEEEYEQILFAAAGEIGLRLLHDTPEERTRVAGELARRTVGAE